MTQNPTTKAVSSEEISDLEFVEQLIDSGMVGRAEHDTAIPERL